MVVACRRVLDKGRQHKKIELEENVVYMDQADLIYAVDHRHWTQEIDS